MIFGPEPPYHPECKAFYRGLSLSCHNGFTFLSVRVDVLLIAALSIQYLGSERIFRRLRDISQYEVDYKHQGL
jgi:hypothetical protein